MTEQEFTLSQELSMDADAADALGRQPMAAALRRRADCAAELEKELAVRDEMLNVAKEEHDALALRVAQLCTFNSQPASIDLWRDVARENIAQAHEYATDEPPD